MFSVLQITQENPVTISWYQGPYQNGKHLGFYVGAYHDYGPTGCDTV